MIERRSPRQLLVEAGLIVASILLAFAIQAWWDERRASFEVREELENVAEELRANRDRAEFTARFYDRLVTAATGLLDRLDPGASDFIAVPDTLAWLGTGLPPSLDPSLDALDALVASGRLAQVRDTELRPRLTRIRSQLEDAEENQVRLQSLYDDQWTSWLIESNLDWAPVVVISNAFWARPQRVADAPIESQTSVRVPNTSGFRNFILVRQNLLRVGAAEWPGVIEELNQILAILDSQG